MIKSGEELTICYLERGKPTPQRRQALKEHFFFTCSCSACLSFPSPMDMKMTALSCPRCSSLFFLSFFFIIIGMNIIFHIFEFLFLFCLFICIEINFLFF